MRIFEEAVEEDGEFAHDGGEGEFGGFTFFTETGVERLEDGVVAHGGEGGHVEHPPHGGAAAMDVALAAKLAAVAVEGCDADERGGLRIADAAELGQEREDGQGGDAADARDLLQTLPSP